MGSFDPGALNSSMAMISSSSMGIPSDERFLVYLNNFPNFASAIKGIDEESEQFLTKIGGLASDLWGIQMVPFGEGFNGVNVEAYKWLLNVNEVVSRRVDWEVAKIRGNEADVLSQGVAAMNVDDVGTKVKVKIPFHIPTIPKPQDQYRIIVNNSNQPFEHIWLPKGADGLSVVHPLENLSATDFANESVRLSIEPLKYTPIESSPFKFVDEVNDLKAMVAILRRVDEFAVDLEHNQYRSFQGLTCLMQISTRTDDFIVDTLKLRVYIGPYLREIFKDPTKRKVMHGADRDILWLQRDFGIYVCNLFDTGQASRVLKMERNTFEHLLQHFCGVKANKEYQTADWRLRPLPEEMLRYAREDTHYLLYIYDLMRMRLLSSAAETEHSDTPLVEVYKRSYDICTQLYVKELLTSTSYLNIYGLRDAGFNAQQLAVVAGLCEWRDTVARAEDESTGYILPNKTLLQIGKEMPLTTSKLLQLVKSKHPYVERNLDAVFSIIRRSMQNAHSFRSAVEHLRLRRMEPECGKNPVNIERSDIFPVDSPQISTGQVGHLSQDPAYSVGGGRRDPHEGFSESSGENALVKNVADGYDMPKQEYAIHETDRKIDVPHSFGATVQVLKKPSHASGLLLQSLAKRKFQRDKREPKQLKLEQQIKSVANLPFHHLVARGKAAAEELDKQLAFSRGDDDEPVNSNSLTAEDEGGETTGHPHLPSTFLKYVKPINETRKANLSGKFRGFEGLFPVIAI